MNRGKQRAFELYHRVDGRLGVAASLAVGVVIRLLKAEFALAALHRDLNVAFQQLQSNLAMMLAAVFAKHLRAGNWVVKLVRRGAVLRIKTKVCACGGERVGVSARARASRDAQCPRLLTRAAVD